MAGDGTGASGRLTDMVDALTKVAAAVGGGEPAADSNPVPAESPLVASARRAKATYHKTARWVLAAFAAVGVLIFGSLPFANLADADFSLPNALWFFGGLAMAAAGIVAAVVAVSLVSEPEDASLGELELQLDSVGFGTAHQSAVGEDGLWRFDEGPWDGFKTWSNPRRASRIQLAKMLYGTEATAHLGPNLVSQGKRPAVTDLINKLGVIHGQYAIHSPAVARMTVDVESREKSREDLTALLAELRKRLDELAEADAPETDRVEVTRRIAEVSSDLDSTVRALAGARSELLARQRALASIESKLDLYGHHRTLVLVESSVMQMRGTFRLARRILAVAAVLTLLGGTGYAVGLPGTDDPQPDAAAPFVTGLPVTAVVNAGTPGAAALQGERRGDCVGKELVGVWVGKDALPATHGPFTVVVDEPANCRGEVSVGKGEGRIELPSRRDSGR
jgi:hypothetical protein